MATSTTYGDSNCSLARALDVVGERWTLLIVRDAFYGVARFSDFATQLGLPRAILSARLKALVEDGVLTRTAESGVVEYRLTEKGRSLWSAIRILMDWGDAYTSEAGPRRVVRHVVDEGVVDASGRCAACAQVPGPEDLTIEPGPGFDHGVPAVDPVSQVLDGRRRLLDPIRPRP